MAPLGGTIRLLLSLLLGVGGLLPVTVDTKYVEGHLRTSDNWAFLARFCFLSGKGKYEYLIEYEKKLGELKLLLYYDDQTQWPAVYKTDKTCTEKLAVLHPEDNQIVPLSPRTPYNVFSGCLLRTPTAKETPDDPLPRDTAGPGVSRRSTPAPPPAAPAPAGGDIRPDDDAQYFDQFLKTSTVAQPESDSEFNDDTNDTQHSSTESPFETFATAMGYAGDNGDANLLENSTDFRSLVEQLFPDPGADRRRRVRESSRYETRLIVSCSNFGSFTSSRERWWYIAIANCDGGGRGLDVKYRFRMTNGPPGDFWHEHFSADEMFIPPILLAEAIAYSMLLLAVFICAVELKARHLYHCTYRLFTLSVLLQWFGLLLLSVTWTKYAVSGIGPFPNFGGIFTSASEITFLLLLLLMAKGYTITRARLKTCATVKITIFINLYVVVYVTLYIYQAEAFDPGEVLNLYESPAGFGLAGLRCVAWGFFLYSSAATIRKFAEKVPFYYPFTMLGSLWILSGPVLTLLGVNVLDPWVRESAMHGALGAVAFAGHLAFLWLTWPSRANKSFPYHVRTNHVGVSLGEDDEATYPKHTYEPTGTLHHLHHRHHQHELVNGNGHFTMPLAVATAVAAVSPPPASFQPSIDVIYDQYLRGDRELYQSGSTPLSYVSFPPAAPKPVVAATAMNGTETINSPTTAGALARHLNGGGSPPARSDTIEPAEPDSSSVVSEAPREVTGNGSVAGGEERRVHNPFLAGGAAADGEARRPHRIILPSLEHQTPVGSVGSGGDGEKSSGPTVPRHLFAAKGLN
ncbi:transmembrane protein 145-like [Anopheles bellator]|uniref:transmembrane protein 145-like n=1 Tax=Anopheles bellator TaxID=139047 RepID=UPI002647A1F9|nr:transmembrane protein 145-like [Anopheles bellator]